MDTLTTEIYPSWHTRSLHGAFPIYRWQCLVGPDRIEAVRSVLFKVMNVDAAVRRRLGKATLDWSQAEACPVVPALRNARYMAEAFQLGEGDRKCTRLNSSH